jgi:uncharacterized repeat protein (TIGR03803 family)
MTRIQSCRLFTSLPTQSRKASSLERLSLPAMICIAVLFSAAAAIVAPAQSIFFTTLVSLGAPLQPMQSEGAQPYAGLVQATDGNFYGTTFAGGASENCVGGCGTVYKVTPVGTLRTLYSFCAQRGCPDGYKPYAGLVQATDGNFYGTTFGGGAYGNCVGGLVGCGTVFKITPAGELTTLHSFDWTDGATPFGGLVQTTDGNLYGTTMNGGDAGAGTIFKITLGGTLTTLHVFDYSDGDTPLDALVQATDGNLYGTTNNGSGGTQYLLGNVFMMTPGGELTSLYGFCPQGGGDCTDGRNPGAALVQASDGNFYGTTNGGGANNNCQYGCGTVFEITPEGELTTLHSFNGTDGQPPYAGLVQASDGNFYGTTARGGLYGLGSLFKMTPAGALTTLYSFSGADGNKPDAALLQATDGSFYGTTYYGGTYDGGTVFRLDVVPTCSTCRLQSGVSMSPGLANVRKASTTLRRHDPR